MRAGILQVKKQELFQQLRWNSGLIQRRKIAVLPFRLFPQLQWNRVLFLRLCWNFLRPKLPRQTPFASIWGYSILRLRWKSHPLLEPALKETLGVVLFQEQCLKVAHDFAGFTHGEGELLRRALGHKRADEQIESFRDRFLQGAQAKGISLKIAEQVFQQLKAFGGYSFAKSHSAAFAVIVYWSAWLKCYYPTAFYVGLLRNEPMGFYPRHVVVSDAIRYGLKVLPVDLRTSQSAATAEGNAIRLGLIDVKGFGPAQIEAIEVERQRGPFRSLNELVRRTQLDRPHVEALVLAGALDHLGERRQLLWDLAEAYRLAKRPRELPLRSPDEQARLPADGSYRATDDLLRCNRCQPRCASHGIAPRCIYAGRCDFNWRLVEVEIGAGG